MNPHTSSRRTLSRRAFLGTVSAAPLALAGCAVRTAGDRPELARIEARSRGRIGVAAVDLASGRSLSHRGDERFVMCSAFKWLLAALVLERIDRGEDDLSRAIRYSAADILHNSPDTEAALARGALSLGELCRAAVIHSDNAAANLLLATLDGPAGFTARVRAIGDDVTRLDRREPQLNENVPGDPRDTTTPDAMLRTMTRVLFGSVLSDASRERLRGWMIECSTGLDRLRAGIPAGWTVGDKTGTGTDENNDLAFAFPSPGSGMRGPLLVVSFLHAPEPTSPATNAIHGDVAREVLRVIA